MRAAGQHHDRPAAETAPHQHAGMAGDASTRKSGQVHIGDANGVLHVVDKIAEAGPKHYGRIRLKPAQLLDQNVDGLFHAHLSPRKPRGSSSPMVTVSATPVSSQR